MSKECALCGKRPQTGNYVSHSNIKTKRVFKPNLQNVRHQFPNGEVRMISVCTRCHRSGLLVKPVVREKNYIYFFFFFFF
ncbi:MAG: 50S ribosomal protein L28, partial [Desulfovibrionaceae bacterium]|nr:50S ribosomal protein L28 [Desulfovibrionaceae bacterium]